MTKIAPQKIESMLRSWPSSCRGALFFGPDTGLVHERSQALIERIAGDRNDPFRVTVLSGTTVRDDPARLIDELGALSMTGGTRAVAISDATDGVTKPISTALDSGSWAGSVLVVAAGELGPRSSLRKLFESRSDLACAGCYPDAARDLNAVLDSALAGENQTLSPEAREMLLNLLGNDRMITRQEVEKLSLYCLERPRIEAEDVIAAVGDNSALALDDVCHAVADGDQETAQGLLDRLGREGIGSVAILRALSRHLNRLAEGRRRMDEGISPDRAAGMVKPPVIFKYRTRFVGQLRAWSPRRLVDAQAILFASEAACKTTGAVEAAILGQAVLELTARNRIGERRA